MHGNGKHRIPFADRQQRWSAQCLVAILFSRAKESVMGEQFAALRFLVLGSGFPLFLMLNKPSNLSIS